MMYNIGDKIVYPIHGAGVIESIEKREILGEIHQYYIVRLPIAGEMTLMLPLDRCDEIGVRYVISKDEAAKVLEAFRTIEIESDSNWNKRHRDNMQKIKSGDIYLVLGVVKELVYRDRMRGLSTSERKMLNNAKQIVISELVLSAVAEKDDIESIIADTVEEMLSK